MKISKLFPIIGILIFIYILYRVGITNIIQAFLQLNIFLFLFALLITPIMISILSYKWRIIISILKKNYPLQKCIQTYFSSFAISAITPALGEVAKTFYLKKDLDLSFGKSFSTIFVDRAIDIFFLFVFVFIGALLINDPTFNIISLLSFLILLSIIISFYLIGNKWLRSIVKKFISKLSTIKFTFSEFLDGYKKIIKNWHYLLLASLISILTYFIVIFQFYLVALALNMNVPFTFMIFLVPILVFVEIIPISISGLGTRDAALILMLSKIGISPVTAVTYSFSLLILRYLGILPGLYFWFKRPLKKSN